MFFRNPQMAMIVDAYQAAGEGDPSGLAMMNLMAMVMPAPQLIGDQFSKAVSADLEKYRGLKASAWGTPSWVRHIRRRSGPWQRDGRSN